MDDHRFDDLARTLAHGTSRRQLLRMLAGGAAAGFPGVGGRRQADAYVCRAGGVICLKNAQCCSGACDTDTHRCACSGDTILCRDRCIPACAALDACHGVGVCDPASGACTNPPIEGGTACGNGPRCANGVATGQDVCDGAGTCTSGPTTACAPYVCGETACLSSCNDNTACAGDFACVAGACVSRLATGAGCTSGNQCVSGYCVDGVCCDGACAGQCEACNLTGSIGTCAAVQGQPVGGRAACAGAGTTCGGRCDGMSIAACTYPGSGTSCGTAGCANGVATSAALCDGAGTCAPATTQACGAFLCGATACLTSCTDDMQCIDDAYCDTGINSCAQDLPGGQPCARDHQCSSGHCVDGVCCNTACTGQCDACNVPGELGTCSPISGPPVGGRAACAGGGVCQNGSCACVGLAGACGAVDQCCNVSEASVFCRPAGGTAGNVCCVAAGAACATNSECCVSPTETGRCVNNVCEAVATCVPLGSPCGSEAVCCSTDAYPIACAPGNVNYGSGANVCCVGLLEVCGDSSQCCGTGPHGNGLTCGTISFGGSGGETGVCCLNVGETCVNDYDCCISTVPHGGCHNGVCGLPTS